MVNWVDPSALPPEKPDPTGPWLGVLVNQEEFNSYSDADSVETLVLLQAGAQNFFGVTIHGAAISKPVASWCVAVHTASKEQASIIMQRVKELHDMEPRSIFFPEVVAEPEVGLSELPYLGYVSEFGVYVARDAAADR